MFRRAVLGIEPRTSRTLSENHTTRPNSLAVARKLWRADCGAKALARKLWRASSVDTKGQKSVNGMNEKHAAKGKGAGAKGQNEMEQKGKVAERQKDERRKGQQDEGVNHLRGKRANKQMAKVEWQMEKKTKVEQRRANGRRQKAKNKGRKALNLVVVGVLSVPSSFFSAAMRC